MPAYTIWNYVKDQFVSDTTDDPSILDFSDLSKMNQRLVRREWFVNGLVVQSVHYADYNPYTQVFTTPIVHKTWNWMLDPSTRFAVARLIVTNFFDEDGGMTANQIPYVKYYSSLSSQLAEMQRRHTNVVWDIKGLVLKVIATTEAQGDLPKAIAIGSAFTKYIQADIDNYIKDGMPDLVNRVTSSKCRSMFHWLNNDMTLLGYPGIQLWQLISKMILANTIDELANVDRGELMLAV